MTSNSYKILYLFILCLFACVQKEVPEIKIVNEPLLKHEPEDSLKLNINNGLVTHNNIPFSGIAAKYYPNGVPQKETGYKNGKKNGESLMWFPNGNLSFSCFYVNGRKDGISKNMVEKRQS